jgi:hypothetical protein
MRRAGVPTETTPGGHQPRFPGFDVLAQVDNWDTVTADDPKVPVLAMIDSRLAELSTDGWRYDDLPEDGQAWRDTLAALDQDARDAHDTGFAHCDDQARRALIQAVQDLGFTPWHGLPASRVWSLWTRYACTAFYSHPWSWNEIGFSGPAYPRGYKNAGIGRREPWEVADRQDLDPVAAPPGGDR